MKKLSKEQMKMVIGGDDQTGELGGGDGLTECATTCPGTTPISINCDGSCTATDGVSVECKKGTKTTTKKCSEPH